MKKIVPTILFISLIAISYILPQASYALFKKAGIEIPFPQRDLHLRSVDKGIIGDVKMKPLDQKKQPSK